MRNHAIGYRDDNGEFHELDESALHAGLPDIDGYKPIRIVLTIAHLDHDPRNNDPENLRALCQRCHNRHDAAHRAANRRRTIMRKKGLVPLWEEGK